MEPLRRTLRKLTKLRDAGGSNGASLFAATIVRRHVCSLRQAERAWAVATSFSGTGVLKANAHVEERQQVHALPDGVLGF